MNEKIVGGATLRLDGDETLPHEVGDEMVWRCPVTGTTFHMEQMDDNHFWFRLDIREEPDGPAVGLNCNVHQLPNDRMRLYVEED